MCARALANSKEHHAFSTFLSNQTARASRARVSKSFERPCALAGGAIPIEWYRAGHSRASKSFQHFRFH